MPSASFGLVPQEFNFNPFETVQQIVVNQAGYYGVERKEALSRSEKYLKQLDLWEERERTREDALRRDEASPDNRPRVDA